MLDNPNEPTNDQTEVSIETNDVPAQDSSTIITDLEALIKSHIEGIERRNGELRKMKEMVASELLNNKDYQDLEVQNKDINKKKKDLKSQIMRQPQNTELTKKIMEMSSESKEMKEALSDYLREYHRLSGSSEIETSDGQVHEIVYFAKLVKKSARK